ncbi:hypothetical protein HN954_04515 [bacterium]|nr:hypothetical protein [bacterium]MBT6831966.1 hypothetical protein [bacterium]MBT6996662.1 hypothetical protein [bacterium]MBT7773082.1 hypothetical protein [bacterium]
MAPLGLASATTFDVVGTDQTTGTSSDNGTYGLKVIGNPLAIDDWNEIINIIDPLMYNDASNLLTIGIGGTTPVAVDVTVTGDLTVTDGKTVTIDGQGITDVLTATEYGSSGWIPDNDATIATTAAIKDMLAAEVGQGLPTTSTDNYTLRWDTSEWVDNGFLQNTGSMVTVGSSAADQLEISGHTIESTATASALTLIGANGLSLQSTENDVLLYSYAGSTRMWAAPTGSVEMSIDSGTDDFIRIASAGITLLTQGALNATGETLTRIRTTGLNAPVELLTADGQIDLTAGGATNGDIDINAADAVTIDAGGGMVLTAGSDITFFPFYDGTNGGDVLTIQTANYPAADYAANLSVDNDIPNKLYVDNVAGAQDLQAVTTLGNDTTTTIISTHATDAFQGDFIQSYSNNTALTLAGKGTAGVTVNDPLTAQSVTSESWLKTPGEPLATSEKPSGTGYDCATGHEGKITYWKSTTAEFGEFFGCAQTGDANVGGGSDAYTWVRLSIYTE